MKFLSLAMYVTIPFFAYGLTTDESVEKVNKELDELQDIVDQLEQHEEENLSLGWGSKMGAHAKLVCKMRSCSCHKDDPRRHKLVNGHECPDGFVPIAGNWKACKRKAEKYGFSGDATAYVDYMANNRNFWGNNRPRGCFRSAVDGRFHFNKGNGGNHKDGDQIFCKKEC